MSEASEHAEHHEAGAVPISAWRTFLYTNRVHIAFVGYLAAFLAVLQPTGVPLVLMALSTLIILGVLVASFRSRNKDNVS